jgi:hypothetical protein
MGGRVPSSETLPGSVGRYQIEAEIGHGMMGAVYLAHDPLLGRSVALKIIRLAFPASDAERSTLEKRFLAEGQIVARLSHPGIVMVHDVGRDEENGTPYIALELLRGETLAARLEGAQAPGWRESLEIVRQIARALDYAHGEGVVHRDIKPANIMILEDGTAKVMDFGVAKLQAGLGLTSTGDFIGTPLYMAPEQSLNQEVDGRTDLFSLGSVAYTLLTGTPAFEADAVPLILGRVAYADPPPATALRPQLPPDVDYLLARSMAKRKEDRYPAGATFAEDVEDVLADRPPRHRAGWSTPGVAPPAVERAGTGTTVSPGTTTAPEDAAERPAAPRRRSRLLVLLAVVGALAAVVLGSPFWRAQLLVGPDEADAAWRQRVEAAAQAAGAEAVDRLGAELRSRVAAAGGVPTPGADSPALPQIPALESELSAELPSEPGLATARLSSSLLSGETSGTVAIWLDGSPIFRAELSGVTGRRDLLFRRQSSGVEGILPVLPGEHQLRVTVSTPGGETEGVLSGRFEPGTSHHLDALFSPGSGVLELRWR